MTAVSSRRDAAWGVSLVVWVRDPDAAGCRRMTRSGQRCGSVADPAMDDAINLNMTVMDDPGTVTLPTGHPADGTAVAASLTDPDG